LIEAVDDDKGMLFDVASSDLKKPLEHFLKTIAPMIQKTRKPVEINGHTDARRFVPGSKFSNWDLSYQRAAAAREILLEHGVADEAIRGVIARGASQLYDATNPLAPQNRRLSFLIKIEMKPKSADARSLLP
ncbi:MAG TPA: OmpA family protein, partial [Kofleriaceae bacterium]|nr:OmpA family protein [Kofleriaceae bacterium]